MKFVKTLSLAAVAAAALMACVGASSASATVLCNVPPVKNAAGTANATCPSGSAYFMGTRIQGFLEPKTKAVFTTGSEFTEITCEASEIEGNTFGEGSATETVTVSVPSIDLTFELCRTPNGSCMVETVQSGTLEIHWISDTSNGTLTANGFWLTTSCTSIFGTIHCFYETRAEDLGTLTGGNVAILDNESTPLNIISTSSLCSSGPKWDAQYAIASPAPLYVANET